MARPSKFSEKQWLEIEKRHVEGESIRSIARGLGISEATIRAKISAQSKEIKKVAHELASAEQRFRQLPVFAQISARNLADDIKAIESNISSAAMYGSMTAHRLASIANSKVDLVDDIDPLSEKSVEALKVIRALTATANESGQMGVDLMRANKPSTAIQINNSSGQPSLESTYLKRLQADFEQ